MDNQQKKIVFSSLKKNNSKVRISKCFFGFILKYQAPVHLQLITFPPNDSDTITVSFYPLLLHLQLFDGWMVLKIYPPLTK